jgi:1,4-alpha-glucan branching enzyme
MSKQKNQTTVSLEAPAAKEVFLAGSFNDWKTGALAMKRENNGRWSVDLALPPGRYEYKFVVDGKWCCDVRDGGLVEMIEDGVRNELGTMNRVLEIKS